MDFRKMSIDALLDAHETLAKRYYETNTVATIERMLRERATTLFARCDDDASIELRRIANKCKDAVDAVDVENTVATMRACRDEIRERVRDNERLRVHFQRILSIEDNVGDESHARALMVDVAHDALDNTKGE